MAAATGQEINVPIIIRSLARDFFRSAVQHDCSIPLDREFLLALDGGLGTISGRPIDKFELSWWKSDRPIKQAEILSVYNIEQCLEFHRQQIIDSGAANDPLGDGKDFHRPAYIWKPNAGLPVSDSDTCPRCRLYRAVALGIRDEHRDIKNLVHGMELSFAENKQECMRRASGFNQLYEFLSVKEQDPVAETEFTQSITPSLYPQPHLHTENIPLPDIASRNKGKRVAGRRDTAEKVRQDAIAEVKRMSNMAPLKWTWGADLDPTELRNLRRSADGGNQLPHSGYDTSLMGGSASRNESPLLTAADIDENGYFSDIGEDIQPVPELDIEISPPLDLRSPLKPIRTLCTLHDYPDRDMDAVMNAPIYFPSQSAQLPPPTAIAPIASLASGSSSSDDPSASMAINIYLAENSLGPIEPSHVPPIQTSVDTPSSPESVSPTTAAAIFLADDSSGSSSDVTPAMAFAAYLGGHSPHSSGSSSSEVTPAMVTAAFLGSHSPHSSASSSSEVTPAMAMAAYLGSHSPHSSASSSSSEITPATAMAAFLANPSPPSSVVEDDHSGSDEGGSDSSVDSSTAVAVFDPTLRGSSINEDPTHFTLQPPGGVFTSEYFGFVEEDWIE